MFKNTYLLSSEGFNYIQKENIFSLKCLTVPDVFLDTGDVTRC